MRFRYQCCWKEVNGSCGETTVHCFVGKAGLSKEVKVADAQLRDLRRTVEYVENNRESFAHIDDVSRFVVIPLQCAT